MKEKDELKKVVHDLPAHVVPEGWFRVPSAFLQAPATIPGTGIDDLSLIQQKYSGLELWMNLDKDWVVLRYKGKTAYLPGTNFKNLISE